MKTLLLTFLLTAVSALAADATGKWSGSLIVSVGGESKNETAYMILKQDGGTLTGTAGPDEDRQRPVQNGKVDGNKLTFELAMGERTMLFALQVDGDNLTGHVSGPSKEGEPDHGKLDLKRVAEK